MEILWYNIIWIVVIYLIISFLIFFSYIIKSIKISKVAKRFVRYAGSPIIAFFGDSTGFGVGASNPNKSLAGLVGEKNLRSTIINDCKNGASIEKTTEISRKQNYFDILFLCCGGVDVLSLKKYSKIQRDVKELLEIASGKSAQVILITPINPGFSLAFPWFLKSFYFNRAKKIGLIIKKEAKSFSNVIVLNNLLIDDTKLIPSYKTISASDRIHPNDEGYKWVFKRMKSKIKIKGINL